MILMTWNLPITKNHKCLAQRQNAQNRPTDYHAVGNEWQYETVHVKDRKCK